MSPLTKNPQKGKRAGWRAESTVCPSVFREGEGGGDSPHALLRIAVCTGEEGSSPGITSSHSPAAGVCAALPKPILPSSFHVCRTVLGQTAAQNHPRVLFPAPTTSWSLVANYWGMLPGKRKKDLSCSIANLCPDPGRYELSPVTSREDSSSLAPGDLCALGRAELLGKSSKNPQR